jgi:hypothetical protein
VTAVPGNIDGVEHGVNIPPYDNRGRRQSETAATASHR